MPKITFQPINKSFEGSDGETVLVVALNHDVPIMHACGGFCACTTCHIQVVEGSLSEVEEDEKERLETTATGVEESSRLACQAKLTGDVVVKIMNMDE